MFAIGLKRCSLPAGAMALVMALLLAGGCAASGEPASGQGTWIDVRSADEYAQEHVSFARNVPHDDIVAGVAKLGLPRDEPIYLYCGSGRRAGLALEALEAAGYTRVVNLGGLDDALDRAGNSATRVTTDP